MEWRVIFLSTIFGAMHVMPFLYECDMNNVIHLISRKHCCRYECCVDFPVGSLWFPYDSRRGVGNRPSPGSGSAVTMNRDL